MCQNNALYYKFKTILLKIEIYCKNEKIILKVTQQFNSNS